MTVLTGYHCILILVHFFNISAENRQKSKDIQHGQEKQHSYLKKQSVPVKFNILQRTLMSWVQDDKTYIAGNYHIHGHRKINWLFRSRRHCGEN